MSYAVELDSSAVKGIRRTMVLVATAVIAAHCIAMWCKYGLGHDVVYGLVPMFDLYEERNIPTYFSSLNLLLTAALLWVISIWTKRAGDRRQAAAWSILSATFLLLSIDEFADLRILLSGALKSILADPQYLRDIPALSVAWTLPALVIVGTMGLLFIPFLTRLKKVYSLNFILAGAVFVFAATGIENLQGHLSIASGGVRTFQFMVLVTIEESLEIFSILYFQLYLLKYLDENAGTVEPRTLRLSVATSGRS